MKKDTAQTTPAIFITEGASILRARAIKRVNRGDVA